MRKITTSILRTYQRTLSPDTGILKNAGVIRRNTCVFYPTCSQYTIEAVEKYGTILGLGKGIIRIIRCHPWQKNRIDPLI